jgi:copper chaperone CopZ
MLGGIFSFLGRATLEGRGEGAGKGGPFRRVRIEVPTMACEGCARNITGFLSTLNGVHGVKADPKTKIVEVSFDPSKTGEEDFRRAIAGRGYVVA